MKEKEIIEYLNFINFDPNFNDWFLIVKPILLNKEFQKRMLYKHHYGSVYYHSVLVSFLAYKFSLNKKCDSKVCAVAGLLHDFYPYPWQYSKALEYMDPVLYCHLKMHKPFFKKHGFVHARQALENYHKVFPEFVNEKVDNAILRHMFPLNLALPKYKESWIVTYADKVIAMKELMNKNAKD